MNRQELDEIGQKLGLNCKGTGKPGPCKGSQPPRSYSLGTSDGNVGTPTPRLRSKKIPGKGPDIVHDAYLGRIKTTIVNHPEFGRIAKIPNPWGKSRWHSLDKKDQLVKDLGSGRKPVKNPPL